MGLLPFPGQGRPLTNAESMLFISDDQSQAAKDDIFLDQGMSSDEDINRTFLEVF